MTTTQQPPNATCPRGAQHQRLLGDAEKPSSCGDCGSEIVHAQAEHEPEDYAVWCVNPQCRRHVCTEVGDMECPDWAHGRTEDGEPRAT
jgi:hypothetical protein